MGFTPFRAGDIVVFKVADREIPIVHRVIKVHEKESGEVDLLTKGDNNAVDDRGLYATGQTWINKEHIIGRAKGYLPYIGMVGHSEESDPTSLAALGVLSSPLFFTDSPWLENLEFHRSRS